MMYISLYSLTYPVSFNLLDNSLKRKHLAQTLATLTLKALGFSAYIGTTTAENQ